MYRYVVSLLSLVVLSGATLSAQQQTTMVVNSRTVNLRVAPSVDSGVVRALSKGTVVSVMSHDGNWSKVQVQGQSTSGWIRTDLLVAAPDAAASSTPPAASSSSSSMTQSAPPPPSAPARTSAPTRAPAPPPAPRPATPPPPPPSQHVSSGNDSYHGGLTLFAGITSYKIKESDGTTSETSGSASGFMAGLGGIIPMGKHFGVEIDLAYVQEGGKGVEDDITQHDNVPQASLLLRPAFGRGPVRVFLEGGAEVGYLIDCSFSGTGAPSTCKIPAGTSRTGYGATLGGGVSFGPLAVQIRYNLGLKNLSSQTGVTEKSNGLIFMGGLIL